MDKRTTKHIIALGVLAGSLYFGGDGIYRTYSAIKQHTNIPNRVYTDVWASLGGLLIAKTLVREKESKLVSR